MEEQKNKEVKMQVAGKSDEKQQKLTYEQLNDACNQLWQQNQQLVRRNKELEQFNMFKRLDYLFKVLEFGKQFPEDFLADCIDEIKDAMIIPQTSEGEEN